ncbi:E3 ubiquitin-protein ligase dbl4-like [Denticeps clupeoides]|nr:E3 ubiquitin-protein ligase dbl4-like [Denticeps clupeoides]
MQQRGSNAPLKFVKRRDDITLMDDPDSLKVEMSCGHAVAPETLTQWCDSVLDKGEYKFTCPALRDGTKMCGVTWPYEEVRRVLLLLGEGWNDFEERIVRKAASEYTEYKPCPGCQSFIVRKDTSNLCVHCTICSAAKGQPFYFCWQCLREWEGPASIRSDRCGSGGCVNPDVQKLQGCKDVTLVEVEETVCPSIRACPTCGQLVEHSGDECKNIECQRCKVEFCFICLKVTRVCSKSSRPFRPCPGGVVPRQTSIPVWEK